MLPYVNENAFYHKLIQLNYDFFSEYLKPLQINLVLLAIVMDGLPIMGGGGGGGYNVHYPPTVYLVHFIGLTFTCRKEL